jgi:NADPH:quinone reductase-like Zn-dependent oxidoreductase
MGNYMRAPASMLLKIPKGVSFTQAASMTVAYTTAIYAFRHIARLERGESVLIQYATGGLGMAAIQLAQSIGAEIYATVGSVEKREILAKHFGIPQSRVFDSRSQKSVDKIMQATGMRGIDVVLCSASGEMMDETLRCIAPFGRFVDVGRVNVVGNGKLSLDVFKRNATFSSFDIGLLYNQKPNLYRRYDCIGLASIAIC